MSQSDNSYQQYLEECNGALKTLKDSWGVSVNRFSLDLQSPITRAPVESKEDGIIVMESWNKSLAFRSMFSEAIIGRWRMLAAISDLESEALDSTADNFKLKPSQSAILRSSSLLLAVHTESVRHDLSDAQRALYLVEKNLDPLAHCFGLNLRNLEALIVGTLDMAVRELCPHNQIVLREAYRPLKGSSDPDKDISKAFLHEDECNNLEDYCIILARYGLKPQYWLDFCEAFIWAMKTHNPYANQEQDIDDFAKPNNESGHGRFVAGMVAIPMIEAALREEKYVSQEIFSDLQRVYQSFKGDFGIEAFKNGFSNLFQQHPDLADFFGENEVNYIVIELLTMMQHLVKNLHDIRRFDSDIRELLTRLGQQWLQKEVPLDFVVLLGNEYLDAVLPFFHSKVGATLALKLEAPLAHLYKEAMHFLLLPLVIDRNLREAAAEFYNTLAEELEWSQDDLKKRMVEINSEILATGTYTQTTEEITIGCRLGWRNSAKCIGRIAWNTLQVRDRRHLFSADSIFEEVQEHLDIASGGTNIQSVITIFRPQQPDEIFGMRFWSGQLYRYAGYKDPKTGKVMGDPANADFTEYLIKKGLWTPPETRTPFDLMPLVLKMPQINKPFLLELPDSLIHEVGLEHPNFPAVKELGLRWSTIPAITNFKMVLGGLVYPCIPFNGWFVSTEIARNLLERYQLTDTLAKAMNFKPTNKMLAQKVAYEMENAILHSFDKAKYTIVDPMQAGKSYMAHCKREREQGRECPGQWSWIGGLVGPTNPTWHLEMRDFRVNPQYEWGCNPWQVITFDEFDDEYDDELVGEPAQVDRTAVSDKSKARAKIPRVLIAFGSETGTAEAAATSLARKLKACKPRVMSLNDVTRNVEKISKEFTHFLAICSTFGNGEPPSNARAFFDSDPDSMSRVSYAILALGSSLYPQFCQAGKDLNEIVMSAGGDFLMPLTCIDSVDDSENQIIEWSERISRLVLPESLLADLANMGPLSQEANGDASYEVQWSMSKVEPPRTLEKFIFPDRFTMKCKKNYELFIDGQISTRSTRHLDFKLPDDVTYETGDHLSVSPINELSMVRRFLYCFSHELEKVANENGFVAPPISEESKNNLLSSAIIWQAQQPFDVSMKEENDEGEEELIPADIPHLSDRTLLEVLQVHVDLSLSRETYVKDLLALLKERVTESKITTKSSKEFIAVCNDDKKNVIDTFPTIIHLLEKYGQLLCEPLSGEKNPLVSLADILVLMPRLTPRYYSISSSSQASPKTVSITVGVLNTETKDGQKVKGVCSNYLARLKPGDTAKVAVKTSLFRKPKQKGAPMILVGSGTGLAPIMGILRERAKEWYTGSNKNVGECHLFFGCRSRNEILYRDELSSWHSSKMIKLHLAISRDRRLPKQYVHDQMKLDGAKVNDLLMADNAHFYICGDARMAAASTDMCIDILTSCGGMSRVAAVTHINQMRVEDRLQYDIYGTADLSETLKEKDTPKKFSETASNIWSERFQNNSILSTRTYSFGEIYK